MSDENTKVVGHQTDEDGETYGVKGEVDSEDGYGLYTPDDLKVEGAVETDDEWRVETTDDTDGGNVVQGHPSNDADGDLVGVTISGGGREGDGLNVATASFATVGGGRANTASGTLGTISGGRDNLASGGSSTVGGGRENDASGQASTVGGGSGNTATGDHGFAGGGWNNHCGGIRSVLCGGQDNEISGGSHQAVIAGGEDNLIDNFSIESTIGGGRGNEVYARQGVICGGIGNQVGEPDSDSLDKRYGIVVGGYANVASNEKSTVGGGEANTASGAHATIPGGEENVADGDNSFAAGRAAEANHDGVFVWSDSTDDSFASSGADQFLIDAGGGVGVGTDSPEETVHLRPSSGATTLVLQNSGTGDGTADGGWAVGTGHNSDNFNFYYNDDVGNSWGSCTARVTTGGEFEQCSDRRLKTDIEHLDGVLEDVCSLRPARFQFEGESEPEGSQGSSLGFIAQEVQKVFPKLVRESEDESEDEGDGYLSLCYDHFTALAVQAIKEQQELIESQSRELESLEASHDNLEAETDRLREGLGDRDERIDDLERRLTALEESALSTNTAPADD